MLSRGQAVKLRDLNILILTTPLRSQSPSHRMGAYTAHAPISGAGYAVSETQLTYVNPRLTLPYMLDDKLTRVRG